MGRCRSSFARRGSASRKTAFASEQGGVDPSRLVFVDETRTKTNMAPLRGWGRRGERLIGKAPHGRWRTLTFLAALRVDRIEAPCVFDGPINGERFRAWVEQFLLSTLKPDDIVILDNLGSHKGKAVRRAVRNAGAHLIFLPPCSPDPNPIEQVSAKLKHWLRQAQARSVPDLHRAIARLLDQSRPDECAAFFKNADTLSPKPIPPWAAGPAKRGALQPYEGVTDAGSQG